MDAPTACYRGDLASCAISASAFTRTHVPLGTLVLHEPVRERAGLVLKFGAAAVRSLAI